MEDDLQQLERLAAAGNAVAKARLPAVRARAGLCPDCSGTHAPPTADLCLGDGYGLKPQFSDARLRRRNAETGLNNDWHAPGTRARWCNVCVDYVLRRSVPRGLGEGRWAATARATINAVKAADPCPARLKKNLKLSIPWPIRSSGDGFSNARTTWYRKVKAELSRHEPVTSELRVPGELFR